MFNTTKPQTQAEVLENTSKQDLLSLCKFLLECNTLFNFLLRASLHCPTISQKHRNLIQKVVTMDAGEDGSNVIIDTTSRPAE